ARGSVRPDDRHDLDVQDPYVSPPAGHRQTTDAIAATSSVTAGLLAAAADPGLAASVAAERAARNVRPEVRRAPPATPAPGGRSRAWRIALLVVAGLLLLLLAAAAWLGWTGLRAKQELDDAQPLVGQVRT